MSIAAYLDSGQIEQVACGGENYGGSRSCDYDWVKTLRDECVAHDVTFCFMETGTTFVKDGKTIEYYRAFDEAHVHAIIAALESSVDTVGGVLLHEGPDEDVPIAFDGSQLPDHLEILAEQEN